MPQMFDWIFFAIVLLPTAFLVWDWLKNKEAGPYSISLNPIWLGLKPSP